MTETIILISIFIALGVIILVLQELRDRKKTSPNPSQGGEFGESSSVTKNSPPLEGQGEVCCGQHLVCERESLLITKPEIVYYDDEELDNLQGKPQEEYTAQEIEKISEVFYSLLPKDVPGWLKSIQLRNIQLPDCLRDEALLIVTDQRQKKA